MGFENLGRRVSVAAVGGPLVLLAAWFGSIWFFALSAALALLGTHEFNRMLQAKGANPSTIVTQSAVLALFIAVYFSGPGSIVPVTLVYLFVVLWREMQLPHNQAIANASGALLSYSYVGILSVFMLALRELPASAGLPYRAGGEWLVLLLISIWICDSAAYFVGSRFGKRKLAPGISPNKSIEGAVGGVAGGVLAALACQAGFAGSLTPGQAIVLGVIAAVLGQLSDLTESMFKRDAGVKDSSTLIPGHGGVLDRFDSELLVMPAAYFYLRFVFA